MCGTFSSTSSTVPVTPAPGTNGGCALSWYLPWMISTSGQLTSAPATLIRTSPMPIFGDGPSSTTSFSGTPSSFPTTPFIVSFPHNFIISLSSSRQHRLVPFLCLPPSPHFHHPPHPL